MPEDFVPQNEALIELVSDKLSVIPDQLNELFLYAATNPACLFVFTCALITAVAVIFKHIFKTLSKIGGV